MEPTVHAYVKELAQTYGQDNRILIWNIWNEAGEFPAYGKISFPDEEGL